MCVCLCVKVLLKMHGLWPILVLNENRKKREDSAEIRNLMRVAGNCILARSWSKIAQPKNYDATLLGFAMHGNAGYFYSVSFIKESENKITQMPPIQNENFIIIDNCAELMAHRN